MLKLKPNCEWCDKDLPADAQDAMICSYECTFCASCVETVLHDVCPNCGGGFSHRPLRPNKEHRKGVSLKHHPAATERAHSPYKLEELKRFIERLEHTSATER